MNADYFKPALQTIRQAFVDARPAGSLILGTGWSLAAEAFHIRRSLAYSDIPGLGNPTVSGHEGQLLWGTLSGREVFIFQGRRHWYEGQGWEPLAIPVYLTKQLGAEFIVLTNAAGSLRPDLKPGSFLLIEDHINAMSAHPLIGPRDPFWGERFVDQTSLYDAELRSLLEQAASQLQLPWARGVYLAVSGPTYETPAEARAFRNWGADAVGCSTVPEAILANAAGLRVAGISFLSNLAAITGGAPLAHADIQAAAINQAHAMRALLKSFWTAWAARATLSPDQPA
ncbi:MAG: purine-nucleoside phosphorylase [Lentisphaerae bacterium]|nr:purine-nucleoside phosphorylase [Lentisphaerota bacterium]